MWSFQWVCKTETEGNIKKLPVTSHSKNKHTIRDMLRLN